MITPNRPEHADRDYPIACECVFSCADDPATRCSLSGEWHVHPDLGRCPVHPDAPGDWDFSGVSAVTR